MKSYIWDTGALSLYFAEHEQCRKLMEECRKGIARGYVPFVILAEFTYLQWRKIGKRIAEYRTKSIIESSLETLVLNENIIYIAGEFKAKNTQLSLADSILIACGKHYRAEIITTEEPITKIKGFKAIKINY